MRTKFVAAVAVFALAFCIVAGGQSSATNPAYLSEMPSPDRVMREVQGTDAMDTSARQMGALWQLYKMIADMVYGLEHRYENKLTPDENRLRHDYMAVMNAHPATPEEKSYRVLHGYTADPKFTALLLNQFISENFRNLYYKANAAEAAMLQKYAQVQKNIYGAPESTSPAQAVGAVDMRGVAKGFTNMLGIGPPKGLSMNGKYEGQSASVVFSGGASLYCGDLAPLTRNYSIDTTGSKLTITIENQPKLVVFTVLPDGELTGPGLTAVRGKYKWGRRRFF